MILDTQANRRQFLIRSASALAGLLIGTRRTSAEGAASQVEICQLVYAGGNWQPRPTALRRLAWEVHKRTAVDTLLEPGEVKPTTTSLARSPLVYLSGDRPFDEWPAAAAAALHRFLRLGGLLIVDPAFTTDGDAPGFSASVDALLEASLPGVEPTPLRPGHVIYRTFYDVARPVGRVEGPAQLDGYLVDDRLAVIRTAHDLGGAWARDNLGNWELDVSPGGERQREAAFRLGVNLVLYALCLDYKDEAPHRRFGSDSRGR